MPIRPKMEPKLDEYIIQMRNLHRRYGLSKNVMQLFKAFGEHHRGTSSPEALGRWLRSSPLMRKACTDTISSLAKEIQKNPTPDCIAECGELISSCTDMLNLASELNKTFMSLISTPFRLLLFIFGAFLWISSFK